MAPTQQKVLYLTKKQGSFEVHTADVPKPGPGQILVKVEATALNPVDWKIPAHGLFIEAFPAILGSDAAGTVEELGEGVTGFAKGDRVCVTELPTLFVLHLTFPLAVQSRARRHWHQCFEHLPAVHCFERGCHGKGERARLHSSLHEVAPTYLCLV